MLTRPRFSWIELLAILIGSQIIKEVGVLYGIAFVFSVCSIAYWIEGKRDSCHSKK